MMTVDYQSSTAAEPSVAKKQVCLDITVAIPTYNGAERLPQVLDLLKQQVNIDQLKWEVIVCDNNSYDLTAEVVSDYQRQWPTEYPLRYCFVAEQGAAFARQRGVMEANGQIVAFLDDDNIPAHDWLSNVQCFAQTYPQAGAFGSQIHGDFQGDLPDGFEHIACFLAIVERGSTPHLYNPKSKILPPAAGLAVRRAAWMEAVPERLFLNHKGKSAGLASEDLEAMLHIQKAGWEIWYNADMVITHQIPGQRLQREYLVTLLRCVGLSRFYIRWLGTKDWQRLFKVPAYIANDLRKLALHYLKNGPRDTSLNLVAACERSLLTSTIASPVFLLRKLSQDLWQSRWDNAQLPDRQKWLRRLTDAFENRQLELYQQEVVFLGSGDTSESRTPKGAQFEILLRLRQDSSGQPPVSPAWFFPTAERYGLMRTLDRRVVQQVCRACGDRVSDAVYSLNLSIASVSDPSFPNFLEEQLRRYQVAPDILCFEIAEAVLVRLQVDAISMMQQIQRLGVRIAIDEITHGEDMVGYVNQLSVDCLKLSQDLVERPQRLCDVISPDCVALIQKRGVQLVAKGVETQTVLDQLQSLGIEYIQGYRLSKPFPFNPIV
ncbi:hormogonium polysaccharide biosynthesis glycosyltransferase HpsE [Leptothoe spongobia]|uniref:EAL domain-containing protein n=1 Tax=Leptothoe spongobia TAU-MAC 1115 TaxID=1967444 RepID=A0A947GK36_9CYAN|nr:hormogonium polysaccharide biosynthesis glycosyltransferase HpsE [Leptothoe spongobia]MBT9317530.1 EAL domain-containing protein [Leptothoe spongobia TAU-MAC 1115]